MEASKPKLISLANKQNTKYIIIKLTLFALEFKHTRAGRVIEKAARGR